LCSCSKKQHKKTNSLTKNAGLPLHESKKT